MAAGTLRRGVEAGLLRGGPREEVGPGGKVRVEPQGRRRASMARG